MPFALEKWNDKAIVVNTQTGKHYSQVPISREKAEAQMRLLKNYVDKGEPKKDPPADDPPSDKKWIQDVVSSPSFKKGAFTKQAKAKGATAKEFMHEVLSHPDQYDLTTRKRAQFMKNIQKH